MGNCREDGMYGEMGTQVTWTSVESIENSKIICNSSLKFSIDICFNYNEPRAESQRLGELQA